MRFVDLHCGFLCILYFYSTMCTVDGKLDGFHLYKGFVRGRGQDSDISQFPAAMDTPLFNQLLDLYAASVQPNETLIKRTSNRYKNFMLQKDGPGSENTRQKPVRRFYLPRTYMRKRSVDYKLE